MSAAVGRIRVSPTHGCSSAALRVFAASLAAVFLRSDAYDIPATFQQDDVCEGIAEASSSQEACALHALQLRARTSTSTSEASGASASDASSPAIARSWSARATLSRHTMGKDLGNISVEFWYDADNHRYRRLDRNAAVGAAATTDQLAVDAYGYNSFFEGGEGPNATCMPSLLKFSPPKPFDWLSLASQQGKSQRGGEECTVWATTDMSDMSTSQQTGNPFRFFLSNDTVASACIGADGVPREVTIAAFGMTSTYTLTDIRLGPLTEDAFAPGAACIRKLGLRCAGGGTRRLDFYRIHGVKETVSMADRDFADPAASLNLLCHDIGIVRASMKDSWVSHWSASVNTSWGVYRKCWYRHGHNLCEGSGGAVGRQLGSGATIWYHVIGHDSTQGQCTQEVGVWFSMPSAGHCAAGEPVGDRGCTWGSERRERSVRAACVAASACRARKQGAPPSAADIEAFEAAVAGCPEVAAGEASE